MTPKQVERAQRLVEHLTKVEADERRRSQETGETRFEEFAAFTASDRAQLLNCLEASPSEKEDWQMTTFMDILDLQYDSETG